MQGSGRSLRRFTATLDLAASLLGLTACGFHHQHSVEEYCYVFNLKGSKNEERERY